MWEKCEFDNHNVCHLNGFATHNCIGPESCGDYRTTDKSLTITLPFHTGTHFWVTNLLSGTVCEIEVIGFFVDENLDNVVWSVMASACGVWSAAYEFDMSDIGKTVFWNEEDALKAFKKGRNIND